ncbi:hypothetical protein [Rhodopirellula bahusiensis]|uniref:Uncharacterized protein n=1 Tax=Rhodopirellula bahusiensis TaxID=2014065 RepID=A0A2G1WAP7_9BACT|nr:hypothetical protein [Rhodopirellula bahusiensis]PHQ36114.1 hypothetical protein CEE69_05370 [Rhodopirellula bahusiensis]
MPYDGPIDLDTLVDLDSLAVDGVCHWTFFAFPLSTLDEHGLPSDPEAQRYIAAVQSTGVPIGIWLNGIADDTGYAAVTHENTSELNNAIAGLTQFPDSYAADLCERLFRNAASSGT